MTDQSPRIVSRDTKKQQRTTKGNGPSKLDQGGLSIASSTNFSKLREKQSSNITRAPRRKTEIPLLRSLMLFCASFHHFGLLQSQIEPYRCRLHDMAVRPSYGSIGENPEEPEIVSWTDHRRLVDDELARNPDTLLSSLVSAVRAFETPDLLTPLKSARENLTRLLSPKDASQEVSSNNNSSSSSGSSDDVKNSDSDSPRHGFVGTSGFNDSDEGESTVARKKFSTPMLILMLLVLMLSGGLLVSSKTGQSSTVSTGEIYTAGAIPLVLPASTDSPSSAPTEAPSAVEVEVEEVAAVTTKPTKAPKAGTTTTTTTDSATPAASPAVTPATATTVTAAAVEATVGTGATATTMTSGALGEASSATSSSAAGATTTETAPAPEEAETGPVAQSEPESASTAAAVVEEPTTTSTASATSLASTSTPSVDEGVAAEPIASNAATTLTTSTVPEAEAVAEAVVAPTVSTSSADTAVAPVEAASASTATVTATATVSSSATIPSATTAASSTSVPASTSATAATIAAPEVVAAAATEMKSANPVAAVAAPGATTTSTATSTSTTTTSGTSASGSAPAAATAAVAGFDLDTVDPKSLYQAGFTHPMGVEMLTVSATNEYGPWKAAKDYPWMQSVPGTILVEPYKHTRLQLEGAVVAENPSFVYVWEIAPGGPELVTGDKIYEGELLSRTAEQEVYMKEVGIYTLNVYILNDATAKTAVAMFTTRIVVKYVKRELRALTNEDKEKVLDAMAELWHNRQAEGQAKYGPQFTSIDVLVAVHSLASNDVMCDGFHEGTGFISHHLALTNTFEESMRAVDPTVTLPYWDFTIEGETIKKAGRRPSYMLEVTPVFQPDWFGDSDPVTNRIVTSRWAGAKMPKQQDLSLGVQNSYGYIRSYWNNNPDDEISRRLFDACGTEPVHKMIPNCQNHFDVLNCNTLGCFQQLSPADGHGPMHVQLGGMWGGCVDGYNAFTEKWAHVLQKNMTNDEILSLGYKKWKWGNTAVGSLMLDTAIMGEYFHIYRSFWRSHVCAVDGQPKFLKCPEICGDDVPFEECNCQVDDMVTGKTDWKNLWPCVLNTQENRDFFTSVMPEEMLSDMTYWLSTASVQEGEMIESASTADPLFWLTHPVIERLLSAKRLPGVNTMGDATFANFPTGYDGNSETWLEFSFYTFKKGENKGFPDMEYRCEGHAAYDPVLPHDMIYTPAVKRFIDANKDGLIDNWEFYLALDPNYMEGNDYVWDHFDWPHCTGESIKMPVPAGATP